MKVAIDVCMIFRESQSEGVTGQGQKGGGKALELPASGQHFPAPSASSFDYITVISVVCDGIQKWLERYALTTDPNKAVQGRPSCPQIHASILPDRRLKPGMKGLNALEMLLCECYHYSCTAASIDCNAILGCSITLP